MKKLSWKRREERKRRTFIIIKNLPNCISNSPKLQVVRVIKMLLFLACIYFQFWLFYKLWLLPLNDRTRRVTVNRNKIMTDNQPRLENHHHFRKTLWPFINKWLFHRKRICLYKDTCLANLDSVGKIVVPHAFGLNDLFVV